MKKNLFPGVVLIGCVFLVAACHQPETAKETSDYTLSGDTVIVSNNSKIHVSYSMKK